MKVLKLNCLKWVTNSLALHVCVCTAVAYNPSSKTAGIVFIKAKQFLKWIMTKSKSLTVMISILVYLKNMKLLRLHPKHKVCIARLYW